MATLYLLAHPAVRVIGITTTGVGAAHLGPATRNMLSILAVGGHPKIPVGSGTSTPLSFSNVYPASFRNDVDGAYGLELPTNPNAPQSSSAVRFLARAISTSRVPVTILSIGGGTNLAMLFAERWSEVGSNIARICMMAGAIDVPGNVHGFNPEYRNRAAEWNVFVDPLGAQKVLASKLPLTLVPLDATNKVPLDLNFYVALGASLQAPPSGRVTPAARLIFSALTTQLESIAAGQYFFWDPLAAVILANPQRSLAQTKTLRLAVNQSLDEESDTSGGTVVADHGAPVDVVTTVDAAAVKSEFFTVVTGGAPYPAGTIPTWPRRPPSPSARRDAVTEGVMGCASR